MIQRMSIIFLQTFILLFGIVVFVLLILLPLLEGRAANLQLVQIYADPFVLYGYAASSFFFVLLYKVFKLLGFIKQNTVYAPATVSILKSIQFCAIVFSILIVAAGIYIKLYHHKEDDPTGFYAICSFTTVCAISVTIVAYRFDKKIQKNLDR